MKNLVIVFLLLILPTTVFAATQEAVTNLSASVETEVLSLEAKSGDGPVRIVDFPLVFPSPFSVIRDKEVIIQYTLSKASNIEILIVGMSGEIIKKFSCASGEEGGQGAINHVAWDGRRDWGSLIGNGVYMGIIVSKDRNKVLGNFKLTAYN